LYIGDWHYAHNNILSIDNRPFLSIEEMNQALVARWQAVVRPEDTVYVLGDMFWCGETKAVPVLNLLPGHKILIRGNHDLCKNQEFCSRFEKISEYMEIEDRERHIVLCHYPIPCFKNHFYGWYHLYAHVHTSFEYNMMEHTKLVMEQLYDRPCAMYNVGAMMPWMDYTPRSLDEILSGANANIIS